LRVVRRDDWQKQETQVDWVPDSQLVWACVRIVQERPHWGNEEEAAEGKMLAAELMEA
jgi:hypothetical protein